MLFNLSSLVDEEEVIACPPSERMAHLQSALWSVPIYDPRFTPQDVCINSEVEVMEFLYGLVRLLKPALVVETGSYAGLTACTMAMACKDNRQGKVVTCDVDSAAIEATQRLAAENGISRKWLQIICRAALELPAGYRVQDADFLFSDSSYESRVEEIKLLKPGAIGVLHDTGMEEHLDRAASGLYPGSIRIETPRGLTIFQGRA
jgi:predicted O-methyltransferase YrrM